MLILAFGRREAQVQTVGDAVASFLVQPDHIVNGRCLYSASDFKQAGLSGHPRDLIFTKKSTLFGEAGGNRVWILTYILYPSLVFTCLGLLIYGVNQTHPSQSFSSLLSTGMGTVSTQTFIFWHLPSSGIVGLLSNVLVANLPQLILSFAYFAYNALFTAMLAGLEWSQMAWEKKSLRVSQNPQGEQRSSYFLQLPYRYAMPLLGISALMHWLVSQSIFLIAVERYDPQGNPAAYYGVTEGEHYACGWSPLAVLLVISGGVLMIAGAIGMGRRKYQPGIPLGGTNSAVIAAACHVAGGEENIECKKVKWGVVGKYDTNNGTEHSYGEPAFSQEGVAYK